MPLAASAGFESAFFDQPAAVMMETPGKKRKRNAETNPFLNFTDQTFSIPSSTPIHNRQIDGSAFENPSFRVSNKENYNLFSDSCMEVKSIADLASGGGAMKRAKGMACDANPFEVVRKPPKKKKKQMHQGGQGGSVSLEESCFENPGLNLAAADKQPVNPFEVPRDGDECKRQEAEELSRCFVNNALNIRGVESTERFNPFEIVRPKEGTTGEASVRGLPVPELAGIENPALEMPTYAIAVPFTPSLKHRINFQELAPNALTPCQMLANMVVCSPEPTEMATGLASGIAVESQNTQATVTLGKRRSLSVINEESDIGEKLDCYQLELENSINEAKARKQRPGGETTPFTFSGTGHRRRSVRRSLIDMKHISNLSQRLHELEDEENDFTRLEDDEKDRPDSEEEDKENKQPVLFAEETIVKKDGNETEKAEKTANHSEVGTNGTQPYCNQMTFTITKETTVREEIRIDVSNPDVQFEEVEDFEDEEQDVELLNNPAPFQRAYRKKEPLAEKLTEEIDSDEFKRPLATVSQAAGDSRTNAPVKSHKVRDVIRRSFRRLIPRSQTGSNEPKADVEEKQTHHGTGEGHGLISSIRHSLRRRQTKAKSGEEESNGTESKQNAEEERQSPLEMSIIAEQPRAVFRQPSLDQYKPIATHTGGSGGGATGATLRNSLRRSTKEMRKQMMKSVFRKQSGDLDGDHHGQHVGDFI
ncbi:uncharacterized protein LOC125762574 [Anopheles funestus]|uniref:uncharacterized protein LOC125762574 n=1 Tax=Anopheles funestus TaxID=62324 RepID=UPI0020C71804|nr:uncharacterized protein LOC125762574 [Anopheles funestus]